MRAALPYPHAMPNGVRNRSFIALAVAAVLLACAVFAFKRIEREFADVV